MSPMSRDNSSPLMGFSVHQPAVGAALQFFPAMGSKQLDEMIDAYVPGGASILEKRAAVSVEFFQHTLATGDSFKFFMVYPVPGSTSTSPTMGSGYRSSFDASPTTPESQWTAPQSRVASHSPKKATSAGDLSNLPGMKIMTKDGRDVTNSASRGCKTKEQRDHAHLMRIIKACDSCRRKKTKCDPSHKRPAAAVSSGKVTKRTTKSSRPAAAPPQPLAQPTAITSELNQILNESPSSLDSLSTEALNAPLDGFSMEWDQFIRFDEEPTDVMPYDPEFFFDPTDYFSPATVESFPSSSTSPSQLPITPIDPDVSILDHTNEGHDHMPILPYLSPSGLEAGSNYVDFTLFSPQSSFLDEELGSVKEVSASPVPPQRPDYGHWLREAHQAATSAMVTDVSSNAVVNRTTDPCPYDVFTNAGGNNQFRRTVEYVHPSPERAVVAEAANRNGELDTGYGGLSDAHVAASHPVPHMIADMSWSLADLVECDSSKPFYDRDRTIDHSQPPITTNVVGGTTDSGREVPAMPKTRGLVDSRTDVIVPGRASSELPTPTVATMRSLGNTYNVSNIFTDAMEILDVHRAPLHGPWPLSSSPAIVSSFSDAASPNTNFASQAMVKAQEQIPKGLVPVVDRCSSAGHDLGLGVQFNEENIRGNFAAVKQDVTRPTGWLLSAGIPPTRDAVAGPCTLAVTLLLTSIGASVAQGLVRNAQLAVWDNIVGHAAALLILSLTVFAPLRLAFSVVLNVFSAVADDVQQRNCAGMKTQCSDFSASRKLCVAKLSVSARWAALSRRTPRSCI
ncbi:hypothetical protein F4861DRAFT_188803 [Xylaria intraflava]|nr:hypothetical protein F4861DRAFT_188803 [Xylaria intraflava]